jgi:hypothetical protein
MTMIGNLHDPALPSISSGLIPRRLRRSLRMSDYLHKSHNVTVLMYHLVFPVALF